MKIEKWTFKDNKIEIPVISKEDIDCKNNVNLEDTMELCSNDLKDKFEETIEIDIQNDNVENSEKMSTLDED